MARAIPQKGLSPLFLRLLSDRSRTARPLACARPGQAWADRIKLRRRCPQHAELRLAAPSALFVHCERSPAKWVSSVRRWNTLQSRFTQRDLEGLPKGIGRTEAELANWYSGVNGYLRLAFAYRPNYVRVDVDDPASLRVLETFCSGANATPYTWVAVNANPRTENRSREVKVG